MADPAVTLADMAHAEHDETAQAARLRIRFGCGGALRYVSHLDLMRVWERACKRAGLPLTHSQGFTPRPKIALAAPLPVGVTSEAELLDIVLYRPVDVAEASAALELQLPEDLQLRQIESAPLRQPSLQSLVRAAEYKVTLEETRGCASLRQAITDLLARGEIPWEQDRGGKIRRYDLRRLILALELSSCAEQTAILRMRLRHDEQGAGRPEQVALALGVSRPPLRIHRMGLELAAAGGE